MRFCSSVVLTQVEQLVLRLSRGECVRGCRQRCLAHQQRQQHRQKDERRRSRYSHLLEQNHRPAHVPHYLYQAASPRRCITQLLTEPPAHTQQLTSGDNEPGHNKGRALDYSPVEFPLLLRKRVFRGVPSALSHTVHIVCSQFAGMHKGNTELHTNKHGVVSHD